MNEHENRKRIFEEIRYFTRGLGEDDRKTKSLQIMIHKYFVTTQEVADLFGVTPETVCRWWRERLHRVGKGKKYFTWDDIEVLLDFVKGKVTA
jgi:predicted transcriptional regulator of viral defense system